MDAESVEMFEQDLKNNLYRSLEQDLKNNLYRIWNRMSSGTYFPPPVRTVGIPKNTSVPHFQDHASDNWEPEGAGSDGVVNRSWSGRRSNMLSWSTCSIW